MLIYLSGREHGRNKRNEKNTKEESSGKSVMVIGVIAVLAVLAAIAALVLRKKPKQAETSSPSQTGKTALADGKVVLKDNASERVHVSVEKKQLEEKQIYFHVRGQKEQIPIVIKKSMIVGRSSICELVFDDPALSRQHFALELQNGNVMIQNLSQSGYTEINGAKLGAQSRALRSGDEIHAGQLWLTIRW